MERITQKQNNKTERKKIENKIKTNIISRIYNENRFQYTQAVETLNYTE